MQLDGAPRDEAVDGVLLAAHSGLAVRASREPEPPIAVERASDVADGKDRSDSLDGDGHGWHPSSPRLLSVGERRGQAEPSQHVALEAGHGADSVAAESEREEAGRMVRARSVAEVDSERRLTVRSRGQKLDPPAGA